MDEAALRLEQIRLDVQTNERLVDLQARRHVAAFAVGLTAGAGAIAGVLGGQLPFTASGVLAAAAMALVATQLRGLGRLRADLEAGRRKAREAIERLMEAEVEHGMDAPAATEP